jgi:hypothetical protein
VLGAFSIRISQHKTQHACTTFIFPSYITITATPLLKNFPLSVSSVSSVIVF